jgi:hypothetical protein
MSDEVARSIDLRDTAANISYISFESPQRVPFPRCGLKADIELNNDIRS